MTFPTIENSLLVAVDLQQKLVPAMCAPEPTVNRSALMVRAAAELGVDIAVTEQYPKGLGNTIPGIATWLPDHARVVEKTSFSVFGCEAFRTLLSARKRNVLIFVGVEAHVCVLQSVLDALAAGYEVIVVADAVSSRRADDREQALATARMAGATVVNSETVIFMLLRDAKNPHFKAISALVK